MKKYTFYIILLLTTKMVGQVGINTTSPNSLLEIKSSNQTLPSNTDGILIPKIDNFPATNPTIAQTGMMVYLTTAVGANLPGFYYWEGIWKPVSKENFWTTTGNTGSDENINYLGNTDNKSLTFKINGLRAGIISNGTSGFNTVLGYNSLPISSTGLYNTALGHQTLLTNTSGSYNVAIGNSVLKQNTIGNLNVGIGFQTLLNNTSGEGNTAVGFESLPFNTTGNFNVANGYNSMHRNISGNYNVAMGYRAHYENRTGNNNTSVGFQSLRVNNVGNNNVAIGYQSLRFHLISNTVAVGFEALHSNTTGTDNTALGHQSLYFNNIGSGNVGVGFKTLFDNTSNSNTAIGYESLRFNSTGFTNTAIGYTAGNGITSGSNNIAIGNNAQVPNGALNNQIRIGDTNITYAGTQVAWAITSDKRWKNSIQPSNLGLKFIQKLNPVSYIRNNDASKKIEYGFIAQELELALKDSNVTSSGIINKDDKEMLSVRYNDLLAPMVKAIQEQQEIINNYEKQMKVLEEKMKTLEKIILKQNE